jgi:hypothetical protein
MGERNEESLTKVLTRLALAQEHMVEEMAKMATHQAEMNGSVQEHKIQLALDKQWQETHTGPNSVHETIEKRLITNERLSRAAVAVQIILALGLAIGTFLVTAR